MMLAPTLTESRSRSAFRARWRTEALDAALLTMCLGVAGVLFFDGGAEAIAGAAFGALTVAQLERSPAARRILCGAFGGLFSGALFAGFFHDAIAALLNQLL